MPCNPPYTVSLPAEAGIGNAVNSICYYPPGIDPALYDSTYWNVSPAGIKKLGSCYCIDENNCGTWASSCNYFGDPSNRRRNQLTQTACCSPCADLLAFNYTVLETTGSYDKWYFPTDIEWQCIEKIFFNYPKPEYFPPVENPILGGCNTGRNSYPCQSLWSANSIGMNPYNTPGVVDIYVDKEFDLTKMNATSGFTSYYYGYFIGYQSYSLFIEYDATDLCCASRVRQSGIYSQSVGNYVASQAGTNSYVAVNSGNLTVKMATQDGGNPWSNPTVPPSPLEPIENVGYMQILRGAADQFCNSRPGENQLAGGGLYEAGTIFGRRCTIEYPRPPEKPKIISTSTIVWASMVSVFSQSTCEYKVYYGYNSIPLLQGDIFTTNWSLLPINFPEITYAGITYPAKSLPFVVNCSPVEDCYFYNSYTSRFGTNCACNAGRYTGYDTGVYQGHTYQKHCNNYQPINYPPGYLPFRKKINKKMLEKQVLSRIKKVHYKP